MFFMHAGRNLFLTLFKQNGSKIKKSKRDPCPKGFTIIELVIIFAILTVLASIAIVSYHHLIDKARFISVVEDIRNIATLLDSYFIENNEYPNNLTQIGVTALRDPWGNPYQYVNISTTPPGQWRRDRNNNPINTYYDLWSNGADGQTQSQIRGAKGRDDIIRAQDGAFIGLGKELDEMLHG